MKDIFSDTRAMVSVDYSPKENWEQFLVSTVIEYMGVHFDSIKGANFRRLVFVFDRINNARQFHYILKTYANFEVDIQINGNHKHESEVETDIENDEADNDQN